MKARLLAVVADEKASVEAQVAAVRVLVLLRDTDEHPQDARRAEVSKAIAEERGVPVHVITARGTAADGST